MSRAKNLKCITSFQLKILAMALMLCDHLWATVIPGNRWLTDLGRIAFPIFAFQIAEGYFKTQDFRKYLKRLFLFALISEIPFNLMYSGEVFFPFHQNVLFTFCIAFIVMRQIDKARKKGRAIYIVTSALLLLLGFLSGTLLMTDYFGFGVITVLLFYFTHGLHCSILWQLAGLIVINCFMITGMEIPFSLLGHEFFFPQQGFAVLSAIPIFLYNGRLGLRNQKLKYVFYLFYPVHMLLLAGIRALT